MKLAEKYTVGQIDKHRTFKATLYKTSDKGLVAEEVETKGGYLVRFPNGNSVRIETLDQLKANGLDASGGVVDMDSGEDVPVDADGRIDFRAMVASSAKQLPSDRQLDLLGEVDETEDA